MLTILKRTILFLMGLLILAFGIAILINVNIGTAPWDSVFVGLREKFGLTVGIWSTIVASCALLINSIISRSRPLLECFIPVVILNVFLDLFIIYIIPSLNLDFDGNFKYLFFLIGLIFMGIGIGSYTYANVAKTPLDMLCSNITNFFKGNVVLGRTVFEFSALSVSFILSGPIGIGTVIFVFSVGAIIKKTQDIISKYVPNYGPLINQDKRKD